MFSQASVILLTVWSFPSSFLRGSPSLTPSVAGSHSLRGLLLGGGCMFMTPTPTTGAVGTHLA